MDESRKRKRPTYSEEFKRDAVKLIVVQGYTYSAASKAVGVNPGTLRNWVVKFGLQADACGEDATVGELQEENRRLRKQLQQAELEREILKKATAYFAKESQ